MDNIRLDETVKKTLRNYEVPYNDADWVQMESMLDVAPKHNPLGKSYSPVILFSLVIAGAAFLLYVVFKPSNTSENIHTTYTPPIVKKKDVEPKSVETHSVVVDTVIPPVKKEVPAHVKAIATPSVTVAPIDHSIKKELKTTEKKVAEKKVVEKKTTQKKTIEKKTTTDKTDAPALVSPTKNSKQTTLSNQESKAKLFQKMLEKSKKTSKQEVKPAVKQAENDTVHIDDENDSNRSRKARKSTVAGGTADS